MGPKKDAVWDEFHEPYVPDGSKAAKAVCRNCSAVVGAAAARLRSHEEDAQESDLDDHLDEINEIDLSDGLNRFGDKMLFDTDEIMDEGMVMRPQQ
jgi:hypothetical protein